MKIMSKTTGKTQTILSLLLVIMAILMVSPSVYAIPDWDFDLLPTSGDVSGPPGSTVGWGYRITNPDPLNWLSIWGLSADLFLNGIPDSSIFDYPLVAPSATVEVPYDGVSGLYMLTWDTTAPIGFINSGSFTLNADWYYENLFGELNFLEPAPDRSNLYSATVTGDGTRPIPEPSTILLLSAGFGGLLLWGRKRGRKYVGGYTMVVKYERR